MSDAPEVLLFSLGGKAAPAELAPALGVVEALPAKVFAEVVEATLEIMPEDQVDNRIVRLCRKLDIDPEKAAPGFKSTRWLLRNAASANVGADLLGQDLYALLGPDTLVVERVLPIYERAFPAMRLEIIQAALSSHANVLTGLEWRVDTIGSTNLGTELNFPVALLTMHYRDRQQGGSFTVQMTPDMVAELRQLCDQLLKE